MLSRRGFLGSAAVLAGASAISGRTQAAVVPEAPITTTTTMQPPIIPTSGPDYQPVVTLNGWTLPWRMNGDWKEFHLLAEPVVREIAPGMKAHLWGYNGQSPGPTIECVEGDKLRIFVTNKLPEDTTIHWHGLLVPAGMDGVVGLNQPPIKPGETYAYEFIMKKSGTFMYHPHADDMVQVAMGMYGAFVVHPRDPKFMRVDRDFVFAMNAFAIDPGTYVPKVTEMTNFDVWTWNSRVFPGIDFLVANKGDRVRIRMGNLTMTNHPIHLHGYDFKVTLTDGGWVPESARWPEATIDIPVGAWRAIEFVANEPGDWAFHCHKLHHVMNSMGHDVKTFIGVQKKDLAKAIRQLVPDYMPMGSTGMNDMAEMEMPLPDNTLPMMTGAGPFGALGLGGMVSLLMVREGLASNDYKMPGWYQYPSGTVAYRVENPKTTPARKPDAARDTKPNIEVVKPKSDHRGH